MVARIDGPGIEECRQEMGLTQAEFAERYKLRPQTVAAWEQSRRTPRGASVVYLAMIMSSPDKTAAILKNLSPELVKQLTA